LFVIFDIVKLGNYSAVSTSLYSLLKNLRKKRLYSSSFFHAYIRFFFNIFAPKKKQVTDISKVLAAKKYDKTSYNAIQASFKV